VGLVALVVVACLAFARPRRTEPWAKRLWGVSLAVPQLALSWGVAEICDALTDGWSDAAVVVTVAIASVIAGYLAAEVLALWLLVAGRYGVNVNELFAAQSIEDYKGFLRLRIGDDGSLTVFPVAVDRVCRRWRLRTGGGQGDPWFEPSSGDIPVRLIEPPITFPARSRQVRPDQPRSDPESSLMVSNPSMGSNNRGFPSSRLT
jgi:hypothetical protein